MISHTELAARMMAEILEDVRNRVVPRNVGSFSQLHDYVDANCYGGTEILLEEMDRQAPDTDEGHKAALDAICDLSNAAMEIVDGWIKSGGVGRELHPADLYPT